MERLATPWYKMPPRPGLTLKRSNAMDDGEGKKKKKKSDEDGATSDGTDPPPCWSDHDRVPGTAEGTEGSCEPEKKKKKSKD